MHIGGGAVVPLAWLFGIERWLAIPAAAFTGALSIELLGDATHAQRALAGRRRAAQVGRQACDPRQHGVGPARHDGIDDAQCFCFRVIAQGFGKTNLAS